MSFLLKTITAVSNVLFQALRILWNCACC